MWNKLSMADRAKIIQMGVSNGITDLSSIRKIYNTYAEGGYLGGSNVEFYKRYKKDNEFHIGGNLKYPPRYLWEQELGLGNRPVLDIKNFENIDWYNDDKKQTEFDENSYATVNPYTGVPVDPQSFYIDDSGKLGLASTSNIEIRPYQGYREELMPYHDSVRRYKNPVRSGIPDDDPNNPIIPFGENEYFESPQLIGEDNWVDPSETSGNYIMAGMLMGGAPGAINGLSDVITGEIGGELFNEMVARAQGVSSEDTNLGLYNLGYLLGPTAYHGIKGSLDNPARDFRYNLDRLKSDFKNGDYLEALENPLIKSPLSNTWVRNRIANSTIGKRGIEILMRTSGDPNPVPRILESIDFDWPLRSQFDYMLFGKNNTLRKVFRRPKFKFGDNSLAGGNPYRGLYSDNLKDVPEDAVDVIDAYLYGKTLDSRIATLSSSNSHELAPKIKEFIQQHYQNKKLPVYEIGQPKLGIENITEWKGVNAPIHNSFRIKGEHSPEINVGGHQARFGDINGIPAQEAQDLWKFEKETYKERWLQNKGNLDNFKGKEIPEWLLDAGLDIVDKAGTPIIFKQNWRFLNE